MAEEDLRRLLEHRINAHRAALALADELGWPHVLSDAVAETRARLEEVEAIAAELEFLTGPISAEAKPAACVSRVRRGRSGSIEHTFDE